MKLKLYLVKNRLSVVEFAQMLDYSRTHLSAVINGHLKPSRRLARAIERETNGEVTADELLNPKKE